MTNDASAKGWRHAFLEDEHEDFRASVRRFVDIEIMPKREAFRAAREIDRSVWRRAGELGFLGFMMPERFGGGGTPDFRFNLVLGQELARAGFGFSSSMGINVDIVAPYLRDLTTEAQRHRWVPRFCTGELVTAIALTEPGTGSDLAAVRTRAEPVAAG